MYALPVQQSGCPRMSPQLERGRALIDAALPALERSYGPTHVAVRDAKAAPVIGR